MFHAYGRTDGLSELRTYSSGLRTRLKRISCLKRWLYQIFENWFTLKLWEHFQLHVKYRWHMTQSDGEDRCYRLSSIDEHSSLQKVRSGRRYAGCNKTRMRVLEYCGQLTWSQTDLGWWVCKLKREQFSLYKIIVQFLIIGSVSLSFF